MVGFLSIRSDADVHIINFVWLDDYVLSSADIEILLGSDALVGEGVNILIKDRLIPICVLDIATTTNSWADH